jgi:hypothetical protein
MTILETERLVRKISGLLREAVGQSVAPKLAEDFAGTCHAANLRLQQCEAMIRQGDRHQAIQSAETTPNLLDWITVLEFQGADEWRQYCEKNGLAVAEPIDARAVEALNECYAQGIPTDHPLYAAYRRAVLSRNDEEALNALKSIVRLNPSDANAVAELERLDGKVLISKLRHLDDLVSGAGPEVVLAQIEAIEGFGFKNRPDGDAWRKAQAMRCASLLEAAEKLRGSGRWMEALASVDTIRRLQDEFKVELPADTLRRIESLENWARGEQARDQAEREFESRLAEMRYRLQQSEQPDNPGNRAGLDKLREQSASLREAWQALNNCRRPIPEEIASGFRQRSGFLEEQIARGTAARRRQTLAGVIGALVLAAIVLGVGWAEYGARNLAKRLDQAVARRQFHTAEKILVSARRPPYQLVSAAPLKAAISAAETFITKERSLCSTFEEAFSRLPKTLQGEPPAGELGKIGEQLASAQNALVALAPDLKAENEARLRPFEQRWGAFLSDRSAAANQVIDQRVTAAETQLNALTYRLSLEQAKNHTAALSAEIQRIAGYEAEFTNHLRIASQVLRRSAEVRAKFSAYDRELQKLDQAISALQRGRTMGDYSNAIGVIASSAFSSSAWVRAASGVQGLHPDNETALRFLLGATNETLWKFIKQDHSSLFIPSVDLPAEKDLFDDLDNNVAVKGNHQRVRLWLDSEGKNTVEWITTAPLTNKPESWQPIQVYEPSASPNTCAFSPRQYGLFGGRAYYILAGLPRIPIYQVEPLPSLYETAAFYSVGLDKALAPGRHSKPLLEVLDTLKESSAGSPIFRAYLFQQLVDIMQLQPESRGLVFAPDVQKHRTQINNLAGGSIGNGDWFVSIKVNSYAGKLEEFFGSIKGGSYLAQAERLLTLDHDAARSGFQYVGFVGLDGQPIIPDSSVSGELWGYSAARKQPVLLGHRTGSEVSMATPGLELSPLFVLASPRDQLLDKARVNPQDPLYAGVLPPLFQTEPAAKTHP